MNVKFIEGVAPLAHAYDGFILDLWGVIYDGGQVFDHAGFLVDHFKHAGGACPGA